MRVSFDTRPGFSDRPSEDFVAASPNVVVVLDGLTSPPQLGTGCRHGTPWYVAQLGTRLLAGATTRREESLTAVLADVLDEVAALHTNTCDLRHPGTPSCAVTVLRQADDEVDYLVIFDSVIVLDGPAGLTVITDSRVDGYAQDEHRRTLAYPVGSAGHQEAVARLVAAQRPHRNQPDGYWVAAATATAAHHAVTGTVEPAGVRRAAVMTDGASCLVDKYGLLDWAGFMTALSNAGPDDVLDRVRRAEDTDPTGARWPRYKRSDDATVAYCLFD
jgi:hypothetical protein